MTDNTQPEALRLANEFKLCNEYDSIPSITDISKAEAELLRQHARIAELEAQLEAVGAGGVQALSAAPAEQQVASSAVLKAIREANMQLVHTGDDAFMLVPYKRATAGQQAAPKAAPTWPSEALVWEALQAYLKHDTNMEGMRAVARWGTQSVPPAEQPIGELVVTKTRDGQIVAVTRQDDEGRILSVIATSDPEEQQAPATEGYVQPVPDKCDRITWRGRYYHLPLTEQAAPKAAPGDRPISSASAKASAHVAREFREAAPQPAPAPLSDVVRDAARYRWLRDVPMAEWPDELATAFQLQQNAIWDAAIDAALAAQGGTP